MFLLIKENKYPVILSTMQKCQKQEKVIFLMLRQFSVIPVLLLKEIY